jgi:dolichol-phosphate mannosyltransferase
LKHLVIIPTYNEKENISAIIDAVLCYENYEVLIVDDGSPDGTAAIVKEKKIANSHIHLIERAGKMGLGTAYIAGFKYGLSNGFDLIYEMDADFSHNPKDLLRLGEACNVGYDLAIGSRYVKGGGLLNWGMDRIVISKGGSLYVRIITGMPIMDPTAGFICYSRRVLEAIDLNKIEFTGYGFQIEMKYVAYRLGYKIKEVPITFKDRELGTSKMHFAIIKEAVMGVLKLRMRNIKKFYSKSSDAQDMA